MLHSQPSPLAGKTVRIKASARELGGQEYHVEDWSDRVTGESWQTAKGNPAALHYALRTGAGIPIDDEVLYGKINGFGKLVHISEIENAARQETSSNA